MQFFGGLALTAVLIVARAFTVSRFWTWYVSSTFHVPTVSMWQAYGLVLIVAVLFPMPYVPKRKEDQRSWAESYIVNYLWLAFVWVAAGLMNAVQ